MAWAEVAPGLVAVLCHDAHAFAGFVFARWMVWGVGGGCARADALCAPECCQGVKEVIECPAGFAILASGAELLLQGAELGWAREVCCNQGCALLLTRREAFLVE